MREILFRGKSKAIGEWYHGNLDVNIKGICIITPDDTPIGKYGQVDPETVGQFTGLTDKNCTKIFEGDIVKNKYNNIFVVKYGKHDLACCGCCYQSHEAVGFYLSDGRDCACSDEDVWGNIEVVGNIHDNPELLKGGAE